MCPYVSLCVPLCPPVSLYQLHPLSGQRLLGCPRENHSTLHIFSKYPPATNVHNMHIYVHSIIRSTHGGWLFNGCPTAQPTTECKKRICPKKLSKSRQSGLPCENLEHQKINDTNHDFLHINGEGLIHQVAPQMIENIMKGKKHEGHIGAKIILTFLVWGKQQFFTADFFLKSPKVGVFNSPPARTWETARVKKPHLWICHFWAFDALWLDGSEWWYQEWAPGEWPAPGNRGLCYENWAKKALGTFHHNWRDKLNGASQWRRN